MTNKMKYLKNGLGVCTLFIGGAAIGSLLLEFGLRLMLYGSLEWRQTQYPPLLREPHPVYGWMLSPNQEAVEDSLEYQHIVTTNERGLRDQPRSYEKKDGLFRIVVLGDSYMEAAHVPDGKGFPSLLEQSLASRGVEVINLGVGGFSTVGAWQYLIHEGLKYAPDLVLLAFYAENDVYGNSPDLSRRFWGNDNVRYFGQPYVRWDATSGKLELIPPDYEQSRAGYEERMAAYSPRLQRLDAFRKSLASHIYQQWRQGRRTRVRTPGDDINIHFGCYLKHFHPVESAAEGLTAEEYVRLWEEAWRLTEKTLLSLNADTQKAGGRFAFFNVPSRIQFESAYAEAVAEKYPKLDMDTDLPETRLAAFAQLEGIPFFNLLPPFRSANQEGKKLNYNHDSHWNAEGHALAAAFMAQSLDEEGLIPALP